MKRALFFTFLLFSNTLFAESLEEGFQAYEQEDYATAVKHWRALAVAGDATAQFNLGQMYRLGKGVEQDDQEAAKWYLQAAQQGSYHARHNLKMMYQDGRLDEATLERLKAAEPDIVAETVTSPVQAAEKPAVEKKTATQPDQALAKASVAAPPNPPNPPNPPKQPDLPTPPPDTTPGAGLDWQNWLPRQDAGSYVLQVMASEAKQDILQYIAARGHLLPESRGYVRTRSKGRRWYVLLLGPYADSAAAKAAIKSLPADLRKNKPWPRRVGAVSAILR